jgi:hypothetical protein
MGFEVGQSSHRTLSDWTQTLRLCRSFAKRTAYDERETGGVRIEVAKVAFLSNSPPDESVISSVCAIMVEYKTSCAFIQ